MYIKLMKVFPNYGKFLVKDPAYTNLHGVVLLSHKVETFISTGLSALVVSAFALLGKATVSFVMSVCPHGRVQLKCDGTR